METIIIYFALVLTGACLGSFAGASVWRLRARQLQYEKDHKEPYDHTEYGRLKKLLSRSVLNDRSQCLSCKRALRWYELVPVVSWLAQRGRCRGCKEPIGRFELLVELGMIAFFVLSYAFWPGGFTTGVDVAQFIVWLLAGVAMAILFAYDAKWFLLPDSAVIGLAVLGVGMTSLVAAESASVGGTVLSSLVSVGILGGLYAALFAVSRGQWVGFGDVKLGAALGLLLADWKLALVGLFLANLIGCIVVIPGMAAKKLTRTSRIPFGPLLIAGAVLSWFIGHGMLDWYLFGIGI